MGGHVVRLGKGDTAYNSGYPVTEFRFKAGYGKQRI